MRFYFLPVLSAAAVIALVVSGCGLAPTTSYKKKTTGTNSNFILDYRNVPAEFNCPGSTNIEPSYDASFNGSGYYEVCTSKSSIYNIYVLAANAKASTTVCFFPVEYLNDQNIFVKPDVSNSGLPWVKCNTLTSNNGAPFTFDMTTFNAAFIVEQKDVYQMQSCLIAGNYFGCPTNFSFGKFK